jgi:hypothetical protein
MNWAMPCAPAGLTAAASKRLSFQSSLAKKPRSMALSRARTSIARQTSGM